MRAFCFVFIEERCGTSDAFAGLLYFVNSRKVLHAHSPEIALDTSITGAALISLANEKDDRYYGPMVITA